MARLVQQGADITAQSRPSPTVFDLSTPHLTPLQLPFQLYIPREAPIANTAGAETMRAQSWLTVVVNRHTGSAMFYVGD